jgi:hypothetical protein
MTPVSCLPNKAVTCSALRFFMAEMLVIVAARQAGGAGVSRVLSATGQFFGYFCLIQKVIRDLVLWKRI